MNRQPAAQSAPLDGVGRLPDLDAGQQKLQQIRSGKHFLIAPPGAGKTLLLTHRLQTALSQYPDDEILCLTFTTRAADEMRQRAAAVLQGRNPFIGNFHAFCIHMLRADPDAAGRLRQFGILDDELRAVIWSEALSGMASAAPVPIPPRWQEWVSVAQQQLSAPRHRPASQTRRQFRSAFLDSCIGLSLLDPAMTRGHSGALEPDLQDLARRSLAGKLERLLLAAAAVFSEPPVSEKLAGRIWTLHEQFQRLKQAGQCLDYDDVLCLGLQALMVSGRKASFLQVDEVQDLSPLQWALLDQLQGEQTHLFAVGDPEQSIYSFLGADLKALQAQTRTFQPHQLMANYRSDPGIIRVLNAYRQTHWRLPAIEAQRPATASPSTLLLRFRNAQEERDQLATAITTILKDPARQVGLLLPTNKACDFYADALLEGDVGFFRVSQSDLMQQPLVQDWLCLLRVFEGGGSLKDWWHLVMRLSQAAGDTVAPSMREAMSFVNALHEQGLGPLEVSGGEEGDVGLQGTRLQRLFEAYGQDGVVLFDTETTSLDFSRGRIIQLAAVRVIDGKVIETFDRYVHQDLESDPCLRQDFEQSQQVHGISAAQVRQGDAPEQVFSAFFDFVGTRPLLAHNLGFDRTMLRTNLLALDPAEALRSRFLAVSEGLQFDTLRLSRQLYPQLSSHKLGDLLKTFSLAGSNSHNALDDVRATASLLHHLLQVLQSRQPASHTLLGRHAALHSRWRLAWQHLESRLREKIDSAMAVSLGTLLQDWLDHATQSGWYEASVVNGLRSELQLKLLPWLERHDYRGILRDLIDERGGRGETLFSLKEADLIDPEVHRVVVSTVHRAKGLEFETAIVPQVTDQSYPPWQPPQTAPHRKRLSQEESCRLLYVALSRPCNKLIVSWHQQSYGYDRRLSDFLQPCVTHFEYCRPAVDQNDSD